MSCNPYGSQGSIVVTPSVVRVSKAWRGSRSRRFSAVTIKDSTGKVVAVVDNSRAVKPKRTPKPTPTAPLTEAELRAIALEERRQAFAATLQSVHLNAND